MDYSTFQSTYADSNGTFQDNTTRQISEGDLRQFSSDILNTFSVGASAVSLDNQIFEIGGYDVSSMALGKDVYIGSSSIYASVKAFNAEIRNDSDTNRWTDVMSNGLTSYPMAKYLYKSGASAIINVNAYNFYVQSNPTLFDDATINRGYVTVFF